MTAEPPRQYEAREPGSAAGEAHRSGRAPVEPEGAGPALRVEEESHPGGPALDVYLPRRLRIVGPGERATPSELRREARGRRTDAVGAALLLAGLVVVAGVIFLLDGLAGSDASVQAAGLAGIAVGSAALGLVAAYARR